MTRRRRGGIGDHEVDTDRPGEQHDLPDRYGELHVLGPDEGVEPQGASDSLRAGHDKTSSRDQEEEP